MKVVGRILCLVGVLLAILPDVPDAAELNSGQLDHIATLIFQNECAAKEACLTSWNKGEAFASLGIGHFIWYPKGTLDSTKSFSESFPRLIHFMDQQRVKLPTWLHTAKGCPWANRKSFNKAQKSLKMVNFRLFLIRTMPFQAYFMQKRLSNALPLMLAHVPENLRRHIHQQFDRVAAAPMGMYALIDYVNFKGEGVNPKERYQGKGWGLLQVLNHMHGRKSDVASIIEFAYSANLLLTRRVKLSPPARHEGHWLAGWRKRIQTYITESQNEWNSSLESLINS